MTKQQLQQFAAVINQPFYGERYFIVNGQSMIVTTEKLSDITILGQRLRGVKITRRDSKPLFSYSQVRI